MKTIVVSAVSLRKGGTLTIMRQCLSYLSQLSAEGGYRVIAIVHKQELANYPGIEYIELSWAIDNWGKRLWCEYVSLRKISESIGSIDLWLSLHDTTPRVKAKRQAVYCQTSFPFYEWHWRDFRFDKKIPIFAMFTRFAYQIGIRKNKFLIVQQEWLREGFSKMFNLPRETFIVAPPFASVETNSLPTEQREEKRLFTFFFASTPDSHKGFEILCEATRLLEQLVGADRFQTIITISGDENRYAEDLLAHWGDVSSLHFVGLLDKPTLYEHYRQADCLVFPSRIETWGLPISEYLGVHGGVRPVILPNLPYAHETSQGASQVAFFPNEDNQALAGLMHQLLLGDYSSFSSNPTTEKSQPVAYSWHDLFQLLLQ